MIFKKFSTKDKPVIIFLHGGGLSWWAWKPQIEALRKDYDVIAPIINGHSKDWQTTFISIEQCAKQIICIKQYRIVV